MATQQPQLIKLDVCMYKKDNISFEDFARYVTEEYPPKAIPIMKKYGVVKWATTTMPPSFREPQREAAKQMERHEWTVPDYDVVMSYWLRSLDHMRAMVTSPEWIELEKEAQPRANMRIGHFVIGHELIHLENNEARDIPA
ncbi:hypothetical protein DL771_008211 [Monosporascus sp. 5C6A]|nr:hypothetical protein DL771_008211 [Monosporascus sp. 5C6A]